MSKIPAIIVDIDGTVADCEHRRHFVTGKRKYWDAFFEQMDDDPPKWNVIELVQGMMQRGYQPVFVTGRFERYRDRTMAWLARHGLVGGPLLMRPNGDSCPDYELKQRIYEATIEPVFRVELVVDDRDRVVRMWRELGLECWQVARGDF